MEYVIVPKPEYVSETIKADNPDDALVWFATIMDLDMNLYFKAVPVEEVSL